MNILVGEKKHKERSIKSEQLSFFLKN